MDRKELLRAVYEAVDWGRLYQAHPELERREVDELFQELRALVGESPADAPEPSRSLAGEEAYLYTDGASRGNPGPAGIGVVLKTPAGETVLAYGAAAGRTTNNVAEYRAVIEGLEKALELGAARVRLFSDSELLVRQLQGTYKVRNAGLRPLFDEVTALLARFSDRQVRHVPREQNAEADALATKAAKTARR
jgi:ribonuclease HI